VYNVHVRLLRVTLNINQSISQMRRYFAVKTHTKAELTMILRLTENEESLRLGLFLAMALFGEDGKRVNQVLAPTVAVPERNVDVMG